MGKGLHSWDDKDIISFKRFGYFKNILSLILKREMKS